MKWNNGKARKALKQECEKLRELGMPEEQVQEMYELDKSIINVFQREARHTQRLNLQAFDDDCDDGKNPLLDKFGENLQSK